MLEISFYPFLKNKEKPKFGCRLVFLGIGNSKKAAKLDAAKKTLQVLIPDMDFTNDSTVTLPNEDEVLQLFDLFSITGKNRIKFKNVEFQMF